MPYKIITVEDPDHADMKVHFVKPERESKLIEIRPEAAVILVEPATLTVIATVMQDDQLPLS